MKAIRLTALLKSNWEEIQVDINNGMLLTDVFTKLEIKYNITRARSTWYTTYNNYIKKLNQEEIKTVYRVPDKASLSARPNQKNKWNASGNSNNEINPLLAATKKSNQN